MNARMRRLASDYEQVQKTFSGHPYITVVPVGTQPPEQYHVTYNLPGLYRAPDGTVQILSRHEVDITLHAEYPRYKPLCTITTPIWHPNFRDGQICIGDIWGAGESLCDIIINIGDMIQYKSWNAYSPLSAEAAKWAIENKDHFPVGNYQLYGPEDAASMAAVNIDLLDDNEEPPAGDFGQADAPEAEAGGNDFEITAEELAGVTYVPAADRMHTAHGAPVGKGKLNFKTVLIKGLLWALLGSLLGLGTSELTAKAFDAETAAKWMGYDALGQYYDLSERANDALASVEGALSRFCKEKDRELGYEALMIWYDTQATEGQKEKVDAYLELSTQAETALYESYEQEFSYSDVDLESAMNSILRITTAVWAAVIALFLGLLMGIGEGIFYGSRSAALKYGLIGAGISLAIGLVSGYLAQLMYGGVTIDDPYSVFAAFLRAAGWSIMGAGVGLAIGLIKPAGKRIGCCVLGGAAGGFLGGFLFNYIYALIPQDVVSRGVAVVIMGLLIGLGIGVLEQFAKEAWLKVIRGEFEGKEYLVFTGTTSIGNNGKNAIVLFKDKLVGPHHCDILLDRGQYTLVDCGTPMGTLVNGMKIQRHLLRNGDTISIGNSVLVFHTK